MLYTEHSPHFFYGNEGRTYQLEIESVYSKPDKALFLRERERKREREREREREQKQTKTKRKQKQNFVIKIRIYFFLKRVKIIVLEAIKDLLIITRKNIKN